MIGDERTGSPHAVATGGPGPFRRSELGTAVFDVTPGQRNPVLEWAGRQEVPRAARRAVHAPSVQAWAVLDGGIVHLFGYGLTSLPSGVYVLGSAVVELVAADLGLRGPAGRTGAGEDVEELRRRHRDAGAGADPGARAAVLEQAELLAICSDAVLLRWVATALLAGSLSAGGQSVAQAAAARRSAR